jgi:hypothetical protein
MFSKTSVSVEWYTLTPQCSVYTQVQLATLHISNGSYSIPHATVCLALIGFDLEKLLHK